MGLQRRFGKVNGEPPKGLDVLGLRRLRLKLGVPGDTRPQRKHCPAVLDRKWPHRQGSLSVP